MRTTSICVILSTLFVVGTILLGGVVHATGSSLACPDWPLCFGQYFPAMEGSVALEHGHRIVAGTSGLLVLITTIVYFWDSRTSNEQRFLIVFSFLLIIVQSLLGGLTVLWRLPAWVSSSNIGGDTRFGGYGWFIDLFPVVLISQMTLGAWLRHIGTKGAPLPVECGNIITCTSVWMESMTTSFMASFDLHRWGAVLVSCWAAVLVYGIRRSTIQSGVMNRLSLLIALGVLVQIIIGVLSVRASFAVLWVTLHLAGGLFLWATSLTLVLEYRRSVQS
ncbi:MAG: heme A synthase [bacterium]